MKFFYSLFERTREALRQPHEPENMRLLAQVYWRTLVIGGVFVALLSIAYGVWLLDDVASSIAGAYANSSASDVPAFNRATLESDLSYFSARGTSYQTLQAQPVSQPDPSR